MNDIAHQYCNVFLLEDKTPTFVFGLQVAIQVDEIHNIETPNVRERPLEKAANS